ncbi:MAG: hypothetical protein EA379_00560 [Phycisphaerales bacterium]|nr:MAG: hypothetical protein EA379_00560 [Phycisphaerales bacterium]
MSAARTNARRGARGMTLIELTLALIVTAMMGLAIASMMAMVGSVAQTDRDGRSVMLRAHAGQTRLGVYMGHALCALQHAPERHALAVWLHDKNAPGAVNLTEFRVVWHDPVSGSLSVERVAFPDHWSEMMKEQADVPLAKTTDFVSVMQTQRSLGFTKTTTLLDNVWTAQWTLSAAPAQDAHRVRLAMTLGVDEERSVPALFAFGFAGHKPPAQ